MTSPAAAQTAFQLRYGEAPTAPLVWNDTLALLLSHRSVRGFLPTPLGEGVVETLVAAASSAPTSSNVQAWSVVAVTDPAVKAELAQVAKGQKHIIEAPLIFVWIADLSRAERVGAQAERKMEGLDFAESFLVASVDAVLAAQNAAVAAESLGLGTVYIGALRNDPEKVAALLGLPPRAYAVAGLVVGHPDPARPTAVKPRLPQSVVLHHGRYSAEAEAAGIAAHDRATEAFRISQSLPPQSWSQLLVGRLGAVTSLSGRHALRGMLARLGIVLD